MENTTKTLLEKIVQEEQDNTIQSYNYDGIELRQSEPVILRNTLLLTMFRPQSFLILNVKGMLNWSTTAIVIHLKYCLAEELSIMGVTIR